MTTERKKPVFYSCNDNAEALTHTDVDSAVEEWLDEPGRFPSVADFPKTLQVFAYSRMDVLANSPGHLADTALETVLEVLDENLGDPDGDQADATPAMCEAARAFIHAVCAEYTPWACDRAPEADVTVNVTEWVRAHAPHWLEKDNSGG